MRRIAISELSTSRWSFHQDVLRYATRGFDSIGIWRQKVDDVDVFETADFLFEMRMEVSSVSWAGGFAGGEGLTYDESIIDAVEAIQLASQLGAECLIIHPGCRNGHTFNHAKRLFTGALEQLVPVAHDFGVALAIEPMPCRSASAWTFFEKFQCTLELIQKFPSEHLGIVLDLYHMGLCPDAYDGLKQFSNRIKLVQLADRRTSFSRIEQRLPLGAGHVPLDHWLQALQQCGYTGKFELEVHGGAMQLPGYDELLDATVDFVQQDSMKSLLSESVDLGQRRVRPSQHQE